MSLNGNLQDFDLSYIFQIIAQEGKTGKLALVSALAEGFVVFKRGAIISAGTGKKNIRSVLLHYLQAVKKYNHTEIRELDLQHKNSLSALVNAFTHRQFYLQDEIKSIVAVGLEDIASELFTWKTGSYSFTVLQNVDNFQVADISLTSDAITMEAARREDEFKRLTEAIAGYQVFIHSDSVSNENSGRSAEPEATIKKYLYACIDGASSVDYICANSFLTHFRIYQELYDLKNTGKITALTDKLSKNINAALARKSEKKLATPIAAFLICLATGIVAVSILIEGVVLHKKFFSEAIAFNSNLKCQITQNNAYQKVQLSSIFFQAMHGVPPADILDLVKLRYLSARDIKPLLNFQLSPGSADADNSAQH
jgi:hypothetical protein